MELGIKTKSKKGGQLQTITGFLSFLSALIALAGLNVALLLKSEDFPEMFLFQLPFLGLFLGGFGLLTKRRSRLYAWWGIGLNLFILVFTLLMFAFAWSINAKP